MSLEKADTLFSQGLYKEAQVEFTEHIKTLAKKGNKINPLIHYNMAQCNKELKMFTAAVLSFKSALAGFMELKEAEMIQKTNFNIGLVFEQQKRYAVAKIYFDEANKENERAEITEKIQEMDKL